MPRTYFGPIDERNLNYAFEGNANKGRYPMGHILILPDNREYRFALNDGTAEVAGDLYQSVVGLTGHTNRAADVARAIDAILLSATLATTAAAVDIYAEGIAHVNAAPGEGYAYRITRAMTAGAAHAAAVATGVLTVNLAPGEQVQVALTTASNITFTRNRYHQVLLTAAPPTGGLAGVSPGVAAADRFYWSQVKGYAAVLGDGTLLEGLPVMASIGTAGAVETLKRRVRTGGTVTVVGTTAGRYPLTDQDGAIVVGLLSDLTTSGTNIDITGGIVANAPIVGQCIKPNATGEIALIDLAIT